MNKSMTAMILCLFSVPAFAEVFVCESEQVAEIRGSDTDSGRYTLGRIIIDTQKGFKSYLQGQDINSENRYARVDWTGECYEVESKFIECRSLERLGDSIREEDILLDTRWLKYVRTSKGVQHQASGTLEAGTCTEI